MARVMIKLDSAGVRDLLRDPGLMAVTRTAAEAIARRAGPGHEVVSMIGRNRARSSVITATQQARVAEARDRALTRSVYG